MANETHNAIYIAAELVKTEMTIPLFDRIRLLFGSRLFINVLVETQRRQKIRTSTRYGVEKVFGSRVRKDETPALFDGFPDAEGQLHAS